MGDPERKGYSGPINHNHSVDPRACYAPGVVNVNYPGMSLSDRIGHLEASLDGLFKQNEILLQQVSELQMKVG